jgi:AcrR family transcriptional regulator
MDNQVKVFRGRPPNNTAAPHGPEEVADAVVRVAGELFAERGVTAVSVREVASVAGVNPGLVHRYVGSKQDLLAAVLRSTSRSVARELAQGDDPILANRPGRSLTIYQRVLAHLILEGHDLDALDPQFPIMSFLIERLRWCTNIDDRTVRGRAACLLALDIGWRLFQPLVVAATGLEPEEHDDVTRAISRTSRRIAVGL